MNLSTAKKLGLTSARDAHVDTLFSKPNVVGVGIGEKIRGGRSTRRKSIIVYVTKKISLPMLSETERIPVALRVNDLAFPTDVIEVGRFDALARTDKVRPCPGGMSIGHHAITAGTFGCLVKDNVTGTPVILSNNHVLANSNAGKEGDTIYQPGPADFGGSGDRIAGLLRFVPIHFIEDVCPLTRVFVFAVNLCLKLIGSKSALYAKRQVDNVVDCAIALPDRPGDVLPTILDIGGVNGVVEDVAIGTMVRKSGRTTELTTGTVLSIGTIVTVNYGGGKTALFLDQVVTDVGSAGGDSGSVILDKDNNFVALLFAGGSGQTIGNPARPVLDSLDVSVL